MRSAELRKIAFIGIAWGLLSFSGGFTLFAEASERALSTPESFKGPGPTEAGPRPFSPVAPNEDIPDWLARWELARVLSYAKRYDESIVEYRKLLGEKPELTQAALEMANVFYWKGEKKKALEILENIPPKDVDKDGRLLMADIYAADEEYEKAEPIYRAHIKDNPGDIPVRLKLAEMLSWAGEYDRSLVEYEKILELRPDDIQVRRKYAFVLIWAGRQEDAAGELKKTLD